MINGVVAEFNPLHNGHMYQVSKLEEGINIAVISGDYVQRGEISAISKENKVKLALAHGYDIVIELPVYYAIQNAEIFCNKSTRILEELNVNKQYFGVENTKLAEILEIQKKEEYDKTLKKYLQEGNNYIKAHELTLKYYGYNDEYKSNNILALEYMKTIEKYKLNISPTPILRTNVGYNEDRASDIYASASYIRNNKNNKLLKYMPEDSYHVFIESDRNREEKIYELFRYKYITTKKEYIVGIYDINEEIYNFILNRLNSENYYEFIESCNTRNISINRIKRIMLNVLLDIHKDIINKDEDIEYIRVLGINEKGAKYLKEINNTKIYVNWKDIEKECNKEKVRIEKNAFTLAKILNIQEERLNVIILKG